MKRVLCSQHEQFPYKISQSELQASFFSALANQNENAILSANQVTSEIRSKFFTRTISYAHHIAVISHSPLPFESHLKGNQVILIKNYKKN